MTNVKRKAPGGATRYVASPVETRRRDRKDERDERETKDACPFSSFIAEQTKLFDVIDGATIGVGLTSSYLMSPLKSVSGLIGLGPPEDIQQYGSPCDRCELSNCDMRRSVS